MVFLVLWLIFQWNNLIGLVGGFEIANWAIALWHWYSRLGWILIYATQIPANNVVFFINKNYKIKLFFEYRSRSRPRTILKKKLLFVVSISYINVPPSWPRGRPLIACFYPDSNGVLNGVFINKKLLYLLSGRHGKQACPVVCRSCIVLVWRPFRNEYIGT